MNLLTVSLVFGVMMVLATAHAQRRRVLGGGFGQGHGLLPGGRHQGHGGGRAGGQHHRQRRAIVTTLPPPRPPTTTTKTTLPPPPPPTTIMVTTVPTTTTIIYDSYDDLYGVPYSTTPMYYFGDDHDYYGGGGQFHPPTTTPPTTTYPPPTTSTTPLPTTTVKGSKFPPWERFSARCLRFFPQKKTWTDAKKHCESMGGSLEAVLKGKFSTDIKKMLTKANRRKEIWVGGCDAKGPAWPNLRKGRKQFRGPSYMKRTAEGWKCVNELSGDEKRPFICSSPGF